MDKLEFFVNERKVTADTSKVRVDWNLATFLRNVLNLTGTKVSCGVGGCGACTVLISRYCSEENRIKHNSVNACLTPLYSLNGAHVLTVEGLSDSKSYHEIQEAMALGNATQCGYCSPGFVMSIFGLQAEESGMDEQSKSEECITKLKTALQGNLCRCTGYRPILEAFYKRSLCKSTCQKASDGCCNGGGGSGDIEDAGNMVAPKFCIENVRKVRENIGDKDGVIQKIETLLKEEVKMKSVQMPGKFTTGDKSCWVVPTSATELYEILKNEKCLIVSGATSDEFWKSLSKNSPDVVIDVSKIKEMRGVEINDKFMRLGASLTINEMQHELSVAIKKLPEHKTKLLKALLKMTAVYASGQVRRSATIGGSLVVNSNASDLQTAFNGFGLSSNFLLTERKDLKIVESIDIPLTENIEHAWYEKIRRRKDFDLALINVAVKVAKLGNDEAEVTFGFGGTLLSRFVHTTKLSGKTLSLTPAMIEQIVKDAVEHVHPTQMQQNESSSSLVETTTKSLLQKFNLYLDKRAELEFKNQSCKDYFKATRIVTTPPSNQPDYDLVHREVPHKSAIGHVTGEAQYCDDIPKFQNELEIAFVLSSKPHAKITSVDFSEALKLEGVVGKVNHEDVLEGRNRFGLVEKDEEIFASEKVTCHGQIIAGIVAESREVAFKAANLVKVEYEELKPVIFTEEDAIKNNSFYSTYDIKLAKGDCDTVFEESGNGTNVLSGEVKIGSQEHFYMEPQSCIVIPNKEEHEFEIISSTQNPTGIQVAVAETLNIQANCVVVKVKRVGGGFGGKEARCLMIALPTAIAANKFGRPVRCVLSRETDMMITGKRATYLTRHKVAFDNDGRLLALKMTVYIGAGNSVDVSMAEIERVVLNLDNAYNIPNLEFTGYVCKTNYPSNTVFRGTGGPQAVFLMENIVDMIANYLGKEPSQVRSLQIYKENDVSPYGQSMKTSTVLKCWNECLKRSNYEKKKKEVEAFNGKSSFIKRGISINPINYGVGYTVLHLNQGAALVHIYTDGTVLISHAGVEIGQGVNTKMIQIATRVLGIPGSKIKIRETATDKVPNTTPSSASMTTDLQGGAVMDACQKLTERLKPYKEQNPESSWEDIVMKAYMDRVSLSATGFYKVPEMGWDASAVHGDPFSYFSSGAACSVVELDCLTGQFQILDVQIIMDVGKSLNPSIDVGQIEGAFMQGIGLFLLEELVYDVSGKLCTAGPVTYKIPTVNDTPLEFNVSFLLGDGNPKAVYSSKAIGEPPLLLATSAFFAVKDAIRAYRKANGKNTNFRLDSPATVQKILLACHTIFDEESNVNCPSTCT